MQEGVNKMWEPTEKQREYLKLITTMTIDCLTGKGVDSVEAYINNLENIVKQIPTNGEER